MARSALCAAALALAACGTRGGLYLDAVTPLPPLATGSAVVSVVPQLSHAVLVRPDGSAPKALRISPGARSASVSPAGDVVAVLGGTLKRPVLDVVRVADESVETIELHGVFDSISFTPDGTLAVLTYAATSRIPGLAARNLNEIDLVQLSPPAAIRLQLDTESLAPRSVVFAAPTALTQRVAVVFDKGVAVFDALRPDRPPRRISVRAQGSTAEITVQEALFSPDGRFLFLRAKGLDDVVVVELTESGGELNAAINFVAGGLGLSDIDVPTAPEQAAMVLAVFPASRQAMLLDARGIEDNSRRLQLSDSLTRIRALPGGRALVYEGTLRSVVAWEPASGRSGAAVLDAGYDAAFVSDPLQEAVFRHPTLGSKNGSSSSLSVVSVEDDVNRLRARIHSIQLTNYAEAVTLDARGERLFFASKADSTLVQLDLRTLALAQVVLDAPPSSLLHLPEADVVAVIHPNAPHGDLTLVPAGRFERPAAVRVTDFALAGDADRPEEN